MARLVLILLTGCTICLGQAIQARSKPSDYPVQASAGQVTIAAEYLVHSLAARGKTYFVSDYLVVEAALFPAGLNVPVSTGQFTLRLNGKRTLLPQTPGIVAASLKYPDWEQRPTLVADAGAGNAGVTIGQPPAVERFPGDPRPQQRRMPAPPRAPAPEHQQQREPEQAVQPHELAIEAALPEGETKHPVAGFVYFAFKGKTKGLKSIELLYRGPSGSAVLRLL